MSEQNHSPTPWKLNDDGTISDANGRNVCTIYGATISDEAFILRAVNAHGGLIAALEISLHQAKEGE